jgi:acyl-coenzyme A thioesterase PaaI-like protein
MRESAPLYTRFGYRRTGDPASPLEIEPYPEICHRGVLRPSIIASAVDIIGSLHARDVAGVDALFTTDLSVRAPARLVPERILTRGRVLRAGRSLITSGVALEVDGATYAYGHTSFMRVPRKDRGAEDLAALVLPSSIERVPLERPLAEHVGIAIADPARGHVEVELREELRNPEGVMQGALVAFLAELAAEALAGSAHGSPQIVTEIDVRYLATGKVGPMATEARWIGEPDVGMVRVELRDRGNDERITAAALLRVAPAPGGTSDTGH